MIQIFINGLEIPEVEAEIATTLQSFSFSELGSRKGSFSNVFELPKTNEIRQAFESSELVTSATALPYQRNICKVFKDGVLIIDGAAVIKEAADVYRVFISAGNSDFFKSLAGLKLVDVDLSEFDHLWTGPNITARRETVEGFVYPNIDYGFFEWADPDAETQPFNFFHPSFWAKTIITKASQALGYTLTGDLLETITWKNLAVLCKGARADLTDSLAQYRQTVEFGQLTGATTEKISFSERVTDRSQLYNLDANANQFTYQPNVADRVDVVFQISITGRVFTNAPFYFQNTRFFVDLIIYDESGTVLLTLSRFVRFENRSFGLFNTYRAPDSGLLDEDINFTFPSSRDDTEAFNSLLSATADLTNLRFGWAVRSEVSQRNLDRIKLENFEFIINQVPTGGTRAQGPSVPVEVRAASVLPDQPSVGDLLLLAANLEGVIIQVDETSKEVRTARLDSILERLGEAEDWSQKLDLSEEPQISYNIGGLAQRNFFTFANDDKDPFLPQNLGRGALIIQDENLEAESAVFSSAFAPVPVLSTLKGTRTMGKVFTGEKYTFDGFQFNLNDPLTVEDFGPRVAILSPAEVSLEILADQNEINYEVNQSALDFQRALANNWRLLRAVTDRGKVVRALFLLDLEDVREIDFTRPVFVEYFGAYFYKQKIEQFKINRRESCFVTLVKISL